MSHALIKSQITPSWIHAQPDAKDGIASVGGLACKLNLTSPEVSEAGRITLGKFIELARREKNQSSRRLANEAGVSLENIVDLENAISPGPGAEVIESVARALHLDSRPLLELAGFRAPADNELAETAFEFAAHIETVKPLEASERDALEWLRAHALKK